MIILFLNHSHNKQYIWRLGSGLHFKLIFFIGVVTFWKGTTKNQPDLYV